MTMPKGYTSEQRASERLAEHMRRYLDVDVDAVHLENYLLAHWTKVRHWAHSIHDDNSYDPPTERRVQMAVTDPTFNPSGDENIATIKQAALDFEQIIKTYAPDCRRRSVALTHLETASMWAVKAVAVGDK